MKKRLTLLLLIISGLTNAQVAITGKDVDFNVRIVADKLSDPWSIAIAPDHHIWATEAKGYKVLRIDPASGKKQVLLDLNAMKNFPRYDQIPDSVDHAKPWPQGGLMGMAVHPALLTGKPYVFLAYVYHFDGAASNNDGGLPDAKGYHFQIRLVRYTYDQLAAKLLSPVVMCDSIPGSSDHNGGRLMIAPHGDKDYLFYSAGDMGAGQFANGGRTNKAQDVNSYEGKILRFNVEPDADATIYDKWIPNDNPFNAQRQNAVWSVGHRNPQGLAAAVISGQQRLYSTEHGPYSDDEINLIEKGHNYGHPLVIGYDDGNYDGLAASVSANKALPGRWHTTYPLIDSEQQNAKAMGEKYRNPMVSLDPTAKIILERLFQSVIKPDKKNQEWHSYAPSAIAVYTSTAIPGWKNSLLIPTLKEGALLRIKLDTSGKKAVSNIYTYIKGNVRYRDIAVSTDGAKIYLAVDSSAVTSGPSKENPQKIAYRGCIIELAYKGIFKEPAKTEE